MLGTRGFLASRRGPAQPKPGHGAESGGDGAAGQIQQRQHSTNPSQELWHSYGQYRVAVQELELN